MNLNPPIPIRVFTCPHHPNQPPLTGFCASCLRERLAGLDPAVSSTASSSTTLHNNPNIATNPPLPELRRCKSFSSGKRECISAFTEPQRKSCDVRVRNNKNTLWSLFNLDDVNRDLGGFADPVIELKEDEEDVEDEIRAFADVGGPSFVNVDQDHNHIVGDKITEIEEEFGGGEEVRTMKDHIDIETQTKKPQGGRDLKEIAGSFWLAASIFSKKLQKWRRKQKMKKGGGGEGGVETMSKRGKGRQFRETQSEVADYGFGRRSCDMDPRFSLDAGRMSFDDPRYSLDEPRASWDGYMIGKMFPRLPPMVEDGHVHVRRFDNQIPVEEPMNSIIEDEMTPGGSAQTRDYYSVDFGSQRRRRSLDRSSSVGMKAASMVTEADEMKAVSNAKVTPATSDYFHGAKVLVTDCDLRNSKSSSLKDDRSESFESAFGDMTSAVAGNRKELKKSHGWSKAWKLWGLIHRRSSRKNLDGERNNREDLVERSSSESWSELRTEVNGKLNGAYSRKSFRSNSSVSSRRPSNVDSLVGNVRTSNLETIGVNKRREDIVLERNRSARYSPSDNGLLRFYLTPLRGSRRNISGKSRPKSSHSITNSVLRLY